MAAGKRSQSIQRIDLERELSGVCRLGVMAGALGNVAGLEACLRDASTQHCDALAFLGDALGPFGHSEEILALIRERFRVTVAGDHEKQVVGGAKVLGDEFFSSSQDHLARLAWHYATHDLSDSNRTWISSWADHVLVDFPVGRVLLCHGSPERTDEPLYFSRLDLGRLALWLKEFDSIGLACAHTGFPWVRVVQGRRFALNCGSVGLPDHDGDPAVHYAILEPQKTDTISVIVQRVEYDPEPWIQHLLSEGVDPAFVDPLRSGWWRLGLDQLPPQEGRKQPGNP